MKAQKPRTLERYGKLGELDRTFDIQYWQSRPARERFDTTWEMIAHAYKAQGRDVRQLRLQRSIETFQRQKR